MSSEILYYNLLYILLNSNDSINFTIKFNLYLNSYFNN